MALVGGASRYRVPSRDRDAAGTTEESSRLGSPSDVATAPNRPTSTSEATRTRSSNHERKAAIILPAAMSKPLASARHAGVLLVASSRGHLHELWQLADLWPLDRRHWVAFQQEDAVSLPGGEHVAWTAYPTNRNAPNLVRNLWLSLRLFRRGNTQAVVTTGAGIAVPFAVIDTLMGKRVVYVESLARVAMPSLTGRLLYPLATTFLRAVARPSAGMSASPLFRNCLMIRLGLRTTISRLTAQLL